MQPLYPLRFEPYFRRLPWGGRRLADALGKQLPPGDDFAECWEISDHPLHQSRVAAGPLAGESLSHLVRDRGEELFGRHHPQRQFPLLFKFLDARQALSIQVHPDDERAARFDPPECGKSEAWIVLHADPGSAIYAGVMPGVDRAALAQAIVSGRVEQCIHRYEPRPGDCFFLPAGTLHALGAGLVVAEVQQPSDRTYRLFDWNRRDANGRGRDLHLELGLEAIHYQRGPVRPQQPTTTVDPRIMRLAAGEHFVLDRWQLDSPAAMGGDGHCRLIAVLAGSVEARAGDWFERWPLGTVALVPACVPMVELVPQPSATLLAVHLP